MLRYNVAVRRVPSGFRKSAVIVCLLTLADFETGSLKFREFFPRMQAIRRLARVSPETGRVMGSGFAFDRRYGMFLESVRKAVPPSATVSLDAPANPPIYTYAAAYVLAPRRVVAAGSPDADYAAAYGAGHAAAGDPVRASIRFGSLGRRR